MHSRTRAGIFLTTTLAILSSPLSPPELLASTELPLVEHREAEADGRIATVVDRQGTALVRPVGRERWSPLRQRHLLMPGDQVRTSMRGANALEARLAKGGKLIVGPGSLIELIGPYSVRLYRGELAIERGEGKQHKAIEVTGPGGFKRQVMSDFIGRAKAGKTIELTEAPRWLSGYKNSTTDEWVGSLIAKVDGRDVPMSVGYHKVDVVIRDQIAQTTVEQSFINSTKNRLEGVFYFPLPADASISGFGMWIGGELVEADIVEKQRAREIYEDILRRKKDPGLLEWSGGNLFKARIFPIEPHSEKRIRIRYTQVLPMEGATVRYRYALRSELLRKRPLRSLGIKISVSSSMKIEAAVSSTHEVRVRRTDHAATLEFDAQEFTPEKDFEVAITLERGAALTVVPHRRGDDGYFMMLLSPPDGTSGKWQRELMPEGGPIDLVLIADTSASMDTAARSNQADFIAALLGMLGKKDTFRLMTADLEVLNFASDPAAVSEASIEGAMAFLAARNSMGWTDIDGVLAQLNRVAKPRTVVVYVGDGIGTTGDADPVALAKRVRRFGKDCKGVVHAVSTASTFEQGVLEALASIGGGSVRGVADDPAAVAYALLAEAAQPAVKDLKVEFEGLRTARVYPETPPNLPVGRQQVLLGRFLPTGQEQKGRAIVTGTLDGKPVRYVAPVVIAAGESGNSFLPRLWARRHLDHLLSAGRSPEVKADIVGFSTEFGIMTPYTSFLVLESDEDRKKYGVERRVRMRDGQKFFAKGRDDASTEIMRQQMRSARTYRLQMQVRMLAEIADLGRSLHGWAVAWSQGGSPTTGAMRNELKSGGRYGDRGGWGPGAPGAPMDSGRFAGLDFAAKKLGAPMESASEELYMGQDKNVEAERQDADVMDLPAMREPAAAMKDDIMGRSVARKRRSSYAGLSSGLYSRNMRDLRESLRRRPARPRSYDFSYLGFPYLAPLPKEPKDPSRAAWSKEILDLVASLDRRQLVAKSEFGFVLKSDIEHLHSLQGRITGWSASSGLYVGGAWVRRDTGRDVQPITSYVYDGKRGVVAESVGLARRRKANARDARFQFPLLDYSTREFARTYAGYTAKLVAMAGSETKLVLSAHKPQKHRLEFVIDSARRVVTQMVTVRDDKVASTTILADFIEKGGQFWARRIEHRDQNDRVVWRRRLVVELLDAAEVTKMVAKEFADAQQAVFVGNEDPKVVDAKQAIHVGEADLADHLRIVTHYAASQQWDQAWTAWQAVETMIGENRCVPLMRLTLQSVSRRGEEFKAQLRGITLGWPGVAAGGGRRVTPPPGIDFLANYVRGLAGGVLSPQEQMTLLESLEPIYRREGEKSASSRDGADVVRRDIAYRMRLAGYLNTLGRVDAAFALYEKGAARHPDHFDVVMAYVNSLMRASDRKRQSTVIAAHVEKKGKWLAAEISQFYQSWLGAVFYLRDLPGLTRVAASWVRDDPKNWNSYHCHLSSLMFRNRSAEVRKWVGDQIAAGLGGPVQTAKLRAAVQHALGQGWNMATGAVDDRWHQPLAGLVRSCVNNGGVESLQVARGILGNWQFRRVDAFRELRKELLADLLGDAGIAAMSLDRLGIYMQWIEWGRNSIDRKDWERARDLLRTRFDKAGDLGTQRVLGGYVLKVLDAWQEKESALQFLRRWMKVAKAQPESVARTLFDRLLATTWTKALEDEAFALVARLQPKHAEASSRERIAAGAIRQLAKSLLSTRIIAALGPVAELEQLPRQERRDKEKRTRLAMRKELAARFDAVSSDAAHELRWFRIEQLCLAAEAGADRMTSVAAAAKALAAVPGKGGDNEPVLHRVLRARCALVMAHAATRRGAARSIGDAALAHLQSQLKANEKTLDWRYQIFRLMIALDRTEALAGQLKQWIVPAKADTTWRRSLGYLLAERGSLAEAVEVFEGVVSADELSSTDYDALANWYLVLGDDVRRDRALARKLEASSENQLAQILYRAQSKASKRGGGLSGALDAQDFLGMHALMKKASRPENYIWRVRSTYDASKDFRVLGCLPYGVVGHTSGSIYRFLARVGQVVQKVHEEATCDSLTAAIAEITERAKRTVDRRGLLLITAQVERRAAEVKNAPGDHMAAALVAMQRAFKGEWDRGERRLMATYLASLGRIEHSSLANEQLRQLKDLFVGSDNDSGARLFVAHDYAKVLWAYGKRDAALDVLTMALSDYRKVFAGILPQTAGQVVTRLMTYYRSMHRFSAGEAFLFAERRRQTLQTRKNWFTQQLHSLYIDCVKHHGEVSLGRGETLYVAVRQQLARLMWAGATDVMDPAFNSFLSLHTTAAKAGIGRAKADILKFVEKTLPELSARFVLDQGNRINRVAATVKVVVNSRAAADTLVAALEREPKWLRTVHREYWRSFAWNIARFRAEARDRRIDARLLPIALREMRIDLGRLSWRNNAMFWRTNKYFWRRAAGDFARVTEKFVVANTASVAKVTFGANYLWNGLAERERAIGALARLHSAGRLTESGQWQLARWYDDTREYDSAIPILEKLVGKRADRLDYRIRLISVQYKGGDATAAKALMLATAKRWLERKVWNEGAMAGLAKVAFDSHFWAESAEWYEAAVRENERSGLRRWNWRNTRSAYYGFMARAHGKLGHTDRAIDAASAAVVTWGNSQRERKRALTALRRVIAGVKILDDYVKRWDAKVAESGLDAPLIRKYLGIVYLEKGAAGKAITQLLLARELQPADDDVHTRLVAAYDRLGDKASAIAALRTSITMSPMNLDLYGMLARRLIEADDRPGAERAYTSMVEVKPNEAESHRRLAKIRDNQKRFGDAVIQWRQVVRVRTLEPDGWLGLAKSQIHAREFAAAKKSIDHVLETKWESRFKTAKSTARTLRRLLASKTD